MPNIARITVAVSDWNDETVKVPLFQLLQWKHAIGLEIKGFTFSKGSVTAHVRRVLSAPRSYKRQDLLDYLTATIDDINKQLGV